MKLLIVTDGGAIGALMVQVGQSFGFAEAKVASHMDALAEFLSWEPTHIIVFDYTERDTQDTRFARGRATWRDLTASASGNERMVRCGFDAYDYPDYVRLPFKLEELRRVLLGE